MNERMNALTERVSFFLRVCLLVSLLYTSEWPHIQKYAEGTTYSQLLLKKRKEKICWEGGIDIKAFKGRNIR